jgi:hypothetical protein
MIASSGGAHEAPDDVGSPMSRTSVPAGTLSPATASPSLPNGEALLT